MTTKIYSSIFQTKLVKTKNDEPSVFAYVPFKTERAIYFVFDKPLHFIFTGATSSPCLIFIFPAVFYLRIVPKEDEPLSSVPKILVSYSNFSPELLIKL